MSDELTREDAQMSLVEWAEYQMQQMEEDGEIHDSN